MFKKAKFTFHEYYTSVTKTGFKIQAFRILSFTIINIKTIRNIDRLNYSFDLTTTSEFLVYRSCGLFIILNIFLYKLLYQFHKILVVYVKMHKGIITLIN